MSDLTSLSAIELRQKIGSKHLSPVEVMNSFISQIERINPAINAVCATNFDDALKNAKEAETAVMQGKPLGLLHGLPLGVKDLQDTKGLLTTFGNIQYRNHVPAKDNALVARLRQSGAIVTAKTNVPDMGAGANTRNAVWGATGNPFNPSLNAGGSSGGSAAALATNMFPICTGSDTGGSLRIPASICGVVGFRPTPGVIANDARPLGWSAISVLGPMGRTVSETAFLMSASVGRHLDDPLSVDSDPASFWPVQPSDLSQLRVAVVEDFGVCAVDTDIRETFRDRVKLLSRLVKACDPVKLDLEHGHHCFDVIRAESFVAAFADTYRKNPEVLGPNVRANVEMAASITLADRAWAHLEQTRIHRAFQQIFQSYDLIVCPVTSVSPFPWTSLYAEEVDGQKMRNYYEWLGLTYMVTLATNPAMSLPCGLDRQGMPFGLQLVAPLWADAKLFSMALGIEQAFAADQTLQRPMPDLSRLSQARPELKSIVTHPPLSNVSSGSSLGEHPENKLMRGPLGTL